MLTVDRHRCRACAGQDFGRVLRPWWFGVSSAGAGKPLRGGHVMRNCVVWCVVLLLAIAGTAYGEGPKPSQQGKAKQEGGAGGKKEGPPKELTVDLGGGVKMEFVLIPPGSFMMGDEDGYRGEKPVHKVTITKPFYLGKYEVTQEEWQAVMGVNPSHFKGPRNPVEMVGWSECDAFLKKLNEKLGSSGAKFSLPTEAQWEYACRAGTTTTWSFGDDPAKLGDHAWWRDNANGTPHPVGQRKPNAWGLYDMHGSMWEWCADWDALDYYAKSPVEDPTGPDSGVGRVSRGGSWATFRADAFRCAYRTAFSPRARFSEIGFRVARTLTP
jgi:formylglycine-generating enzyme required for sulfatase activity